MRYIIRLAFISAITLILISCNLKKEDNMSNNVEKSTPSQFVFKTENLKRYTFPTHINDLIVDRADASYAEVFMVIVEPGKTVIHHKHDDTEQIFYMLEGEGILLIGEDKDEFPMVPGDVVRIPLSTYHSVRTVSEQPVKYLCVDAFGGTPDHEPTWDSHVKVVCEKNDWDFEKVVSGGY
jgi:mannose-6-phosphate isomerase-like protein (cupin superfamily)